MLYFAYGSNLNWHQMFKIRCPEAKYIRQHNLAGYKLVFSHYDPSRVFGHANIEKKKGLKVPGAIWKITKKNENTLDVYEGYPIYYQKKYFIYKEQRVLVYIQKKFIKRKPSSEYLHTIIKGYKDCNLDINYLKKRISYYTINYNINW